MMNFAHLTIAPPSLDAS